VYLFLHLSRTRWLAILVSPHPELLRLGLFSIVFPPHQRYKVEGSQHTVPFPFDAKGVFLNVTGSGRTAYRAQVPLNGRFLDGYFRD